MKSLGYWAVFAVAVLAEVLGDVQTADHNTTQPLIAPSGAPQKHLVVKRSKRHSSAYSPRVYFPGYYYAQPWLRPQYAQPIESAASPNTRRWRRGTTSQPTKQQRYSIWDLSRRRRKRRSTPAEPQSRHKRQIDFYDGGNALSSGYSLADQQPRFPGRSPGIEQSYYHANSPYTAWDLSRRRRRRRRRQVLSAADSDGDDSNVAQSPNGRTDNGDRLPQYTVWDLARRRRREAIRRRTRQSH